MITQNKEKNKLYNMSQLLPFTEKLWPRLMKEYQQNLIPMSVHSCCNWLHFTKIRKGS